VEKERGYDLILHYNDATDDAEPRSEANITRKMQARALIPIFTAPGIDINSDILTALNDRARALENRAPTRSPRRPRPSRDRLSRGSD
jgi:hypothetical protein